jgi:hypothetical protein
MSGACTAWFYSPAKDRVTGLNVINKIVAGIDQPFCHVELQFPSGEACSIVMQGVVSLRKRPFDREFYTPVIVRADALAVEAALIILLLMIITHQTVSQRQRARAQALNGRTFCSKLVMDLLCDSGMLGGEKDEVTLVQSRMLTPSTLFRVLQQRPCQSQPQLAISFVHTLRYAAVQSLAQTAVAFKHKDIKTLNHK